MLSWLRRLLTRHPAPTPVSSPPDLLSAVASLERRVNKLDSERLEILTEWTKTRDQVIRYMKRAGAMRARLEADDPESDGEPGEDAELDRLVLRMRGANGSR